MLRSLVVYGAAAFAVLQVIEPVMHGLHLPDWVLSVVVVLLGFGFPVVTGLAWAFDLTASGVERTSPVEEGRAGRLRGLRLALILLGLGLAAAAPGVAWHFLWGAGSAGARGGFTAEGPLAGARFERVTDFDGEEAAAAVSRDGRFVAFQSDRDGRMDVWLTVLGTGRFTNLTRGTATDIVNPSLRALGFAPDGSVVTFWRRGRSGPGTPDFGVWAEPLLGGPPMPYLEGVAEYDWSRDGRRLVFHTAGPGDPLFVSDTGQTSDARMIFSAPAGLHAHFPIWSPDQAHLYLVLGSLPDHLDLWRVPRAGGAPERLTHHDANVSHPVFLDARTILYLATDPDGHGPYIHALDLKRRRSLRVSTGIDRYTSLAASSDGRRIVATLSNPKRSLWRVPLAGGRAELSAARRIPLTTGTGSAPRMGPGWIVYVSSKGAGDGIWRLQDGEATEIWSAPDARVIGGPAVRRDGHRIAFAVRHGGRTILYAVNPDGTDLQRITADLDLRGSPAWTPDGRALVVGAVVEGVPRLFQVPADGAAPTPFVDEQSIDAAWSSAGDLVAYTGADVGTTFPVRAARRDGSPVRVPPLSLTRGARRLVFLPAGRSLLVLRGDLRHRDLWEVDLDTGLERRVTELPVDFLVRDFDVSLDGSELVLERVQARSDVVLIELPSR